MTDTLWTFEGIIVQLLYKMGLPQQTTVSHITKLTETCCFGVEENQNIITFQPINISLHSYTQNVGINFRYTLVYDMYLFD